MNELKDFFLVGSHLIRDHLLHLLLLSCHLLDEALEGGHINARAGLLLLTYGLLDLLNLVIKRRQFLCQTSLGGLLVILQLRECPALVLLHCRVLAQTLAKLVVLTLHLFNFLEQLSLLLSHSFDKSFRLRFFLGLILNSLLLTFVNRFYSLEAFLQFLELLHELVAVISLSLIDSLLTLLEQLGLLLVDDLVRVLEHPSFVLLIRSRLIDDVVDFPGLI